MSYAAQIVISPEEGTRRVSRRLVNFAASLRDSGVAATSASVMDLTADGCRLRCASALVPESIIWVKITGLPAARARIAWSKDDEAGCEFITPLDPHAVDQLTSPTVRRMELLFGPKSARR